MTNHVHLIVEPSEDIESLGKLMKRLAGRQTRYVNTLEKRTGSLWEGRYKSHPVESEQYLMTCCRYVELNPVRAKMVEVAEEYRWSSYKAKIGLSDYRKVDEDRCYYSLGADRAIRESRYKAMVEMGVSEQDIKAIREAAQYGQPLGSKRFNEQIEQKLGVRLSHMKRGRPRKQNAEEY